MTVRTLIIAAVASLIAACSTTGTLLPVSGAYYDAGYTAPIKAKLEGLERNGGKMMLTLPDGEYLEGRWSIVDKAQSVASWGDLMVLPDPAITRLSSNPDAYRATAYLTGERGTTMDVEYIINSTTARGQGAARDSLGNIYRLVF